MQVLVNNKKIIHQIQTGNGSGMAEIISKQAKIGRIFPDYTDRNGLPKAFNTSLKNIKEEWE